MHFFYTLLVSGLLILNEVPVEQVSPLNVNHPHQRTVISLPQIKLGVPTDVSSTQPDAVSLVSQPPLVAERASFATEAAPNPVDVKAGESQATPMPVAAIPQTTPVPTLPPKTLPDNGVLATYRQPSALPVTGYAMYYNPNIMQEVLHYRLEMGEVAQCQECIGNVALLRAGDLNRRVWLQWQDGDVEGPYLVVDVAAQHHVTQLLNRNWVVDVDNRTAMRRGMAGPVLVTVWGAPPAGQSSAPPFAPLYSTMPAENAVAVATPMPAPSAMPNTALEVVPSGLPTHTPIPTITPLPIIGATPTAQAAVVQGGFPTDTPMPTVTPLPVIDSTLATTAPDVQGGFPTDTPVPTITPLPFITATFTPESAPKLAVEAVTTATPLPMIDATPTPTQSFPPTALPTPTATADNQEMPPGDVVVPRGFPTETPVPTMTPLPVITPLPSPPPMSDN